MVEIIIKGKRPTKIGKTRSEQEINIRKEWDGTMSEENLDKLKFAEKKVKEEVGSKENFISQIEIEKVK